MNITLYIRVLELVVKVDFTLYDVIFNPFNPGPTIYNGIVHALILIKPYRSVGMILRL